MGVLKCAALGAANHYAGPVVLKLKCASETSNRLVKKNRLLFTRAIDSVALGWGPSPQVMLLLPIGTTHWESRLQKDILSIQYHFPLTLPCTSPPTLFLWLQAPNHWLAPESDSHMTSPVSPSADLFLLPFSLALTSLDPSPTQRSYSVISRHDQSFYWGCVDTCKGMEGYSSSDL